MAVFETLLYDERHGVGWVTLNRPEVDNAFDPCVRAELRSLWRSLRRNDDVRCVVLTGAGETAFCTGIDHGACDVDGPQHAPGHRPRLGALGGPPRHPGRHDQRGAGDFQGERPNYRVR